MCEVEDPTRNLRSLCPSVPGPGKFYKSVGDDSVFMGGGFIVSPRERLMLLPLSEQTMDGVHDVW